MPPIQPLSPPYTNIIATGLANTGFRESSQFSAAEFSAGNSVWFGWMIVPSTNAPSGSSADFNSGPIIPNSALPIVLSGFTTRNGVLFDPNWYDVAPVQNGVDGVSHFAEMSAEAKEFGSGASAPGFYHEELTELDASSNGWVIATDYQVSAHDLAVLQLKAPKKITLKAATTPKPGKVSVTIVNLGTQTETFPTKQSVEDVVQLNIESLGTNCVAPVTVLQSLAPLPVVLAPKQKLKLTYLVAIGCANDSMAGAGHEDYRFTVHVNTSAIDGLADLHPANDDCPRSPDGSPLDKGCGSKTPSGTLGGNVLTDVVEK